MNVALRLVHFEEEEEEATMPKLKAQQKLSKL
jgi:hypothetical protein